MAEAVTLFLTFLTRTFRTLTFTMPVVLLSESKQMQVSQATASCFRVVFRLLSSYHPVNPRQVFELLVVPLDKPQKKLYKYFRK